MAGIEQEYWESRSKSRHPCKGTGPIFALPSVAAAVTPSRLSMIVIEWEPKWAQKFSRSRRESSLVDWKQSTPETYGRYSIDEGHTPLDAMQGRAQHPPL